MADTFLWSEIFNRRKYCIFQEEINIKDGLEKFNPAKRISIIYLIAGCGYSEYNMQMLVCNEYDKTNEGYKMFQIEQSMKFLAD